MPDVGSNCGEERFGVTDPLGCGQYGQGGSRLAVYPRRVEHVVATGEHVGPEVTFCCIVGVLLLIPLRWEAAPLWARCFPGPRERWVGGGKRLRRDLAARSCSAEVEEAALRERRENVPWFPATPRQRRWVASAMKACQGRRRPIAGSGQRPPARLRRGDARSLQTPEWG